MRYARVLLGFLVIISAARAVPAQAVPATCGGNANGVLDITADGRLTYVQNNSDRPVNTTFSNANAGFGIHLNPGEKKAIAVNGQGILFSSCQANF
jgi:hypothetical protein